MNFIPGKLSGVWLIEFSPATDIRGFFSRIYCQEEFKAHGLDMVVVQTAISFNRKRGTLRGLHFQRPPFWEKKLVCCLQGSIFDVVVDLRETSPTRWQWWAVELSAWNHRMLYIPEGFAHGYQTLSEPTTILYHLSECYRPEAAAGLRWNDPALKISWPLEPTVISERDQKHRLIHREKS